MIKKKIALEVNVDKGRIKKNLITKNVINCKFLHDKHDRSGFRSASFTKKIPLLELIIMLCFLWVRGGEFKSIR